MVSVAVGWNTVVAGDGGMDNGTADDVLLVSDGSGSGAIITVDVVAGFCA